MALSIYDIDNSVLVQEQLRPKFRQTKWLGWLLALLTPLFRRHDEFLVLRDSAWYFIRHNSEVIYLEKMLNEKFSPVGYDNQDHENTKAIYIDDGEAPTPQYIFRKVEVQPVFLNPRIYIKTRAEIAALYSDFIIKIPSAITFIEAKVRAEVNKYKLAGKIYKIEVI